MKMEPKGSTPPSKTMAQGSINLQDTAASKHTCTLYIHVYQCMTVYHQKEHLKRSRMVQISAS